MRELETAARFALQIVQERTIVHDRGQQELERHVAFQLFITREPDNSHSAAAQNLHERVTAKDFLTVRIFPRGHVEPEPGAFLSHIVSVRKARFEIKRNCSALAASIPKDRCLARAPCKTKCSENLFLYRVGADCSKNSRGRFQPQRKQTAGHDRDDHCDEWDKNAP